MRSSLNEIIDYDPRFYSQIYLRNIDIENIPIEELYDKYFTDHVIKYKNSADYDICLRRDNDLFYYVEENADYFDKIKVLFPKFYKSHLPFYFAWSANSLLCLNDSWTCLGWVDVILNHTKHLQSEEITLIHFDSHSDIGNPLLAKNIKTNEYFDLLSGNQIKTNNLIDFFTSIAIGSIGISNYISILPVFFKKVNILYINQFRGVSKNLRYKLDFIEDDLFKRRYPHLLRFQNIYTNIDSDKDYPCTYIESDDIDILELVTNNKIFLHFDMDYFNNWLDGSAKKYRSTNYDLDIAQQYKEIDRVTRKLEKLCNNIIHTSIGLSPGFFPSKYWIDATKYLINKLNHHGIHFSTQNVFPSFDTI